MGLLSRLTDRLFKPLVERTEYVSPNGGQPDLVRAVIVYRKGTTPPTEDEARSVFLATLDLVKHSDPVAVRILERHSLGSRNVGLMIADNVEGPDIESCARKVLDMARRTLETEGFTGRFSVHPSTSAQGITYFAVLFEPAPPPAAK